MTAATTDAAIDPLGEFRSWASVLFALLGAVTLTAGAMVLPATSPPQTYLVVMAMSVGATVFFGLSLAIGRRDSWAIHAIVPVCVLLIVAGLLRAAVAIAHGQISVPLEVLGAIAVLSRPHRVDVMPALTRRGQRAVWVVVAGLVVTGLLPFAAWPVLASALFGAKEDDLALRLELDCSGEAESRVPITARTSWTWTREVPFAPPADAVQIQWLVTTGDAPASGTAMLATRVSDPSTMSVGVTTGATDALLEGARWQGSQAVDVAVGRAASEVEDGWVEVDIEPNDVPLDAIEFQAVYAHGDRWVRRSGPMFCS